MLVYPTPGSNSAMVLIEPIVIAENFNAVANVEVILADARLALNPVLLVDPVLNVMPVLRYTFLTLRITS